MFLLHDIPNGHDLIIAKYRIIINLKKKFWWQLLFWLTSKKLYWFFLANKYCFFSIISYFLIKLQHELMCYCHTRLLSRLTMKNIHFLWEWNPVEFFSGQINLSEIKKLWKCIFLTWQNNILPSDWNIVTHSTRFPAPSQILQILPPAILFKTVEISQDILSPSFQRRPSCCGILP